MIFNSTMHTLQDCIGMSTLTPRRLNYAKCILLFTALHVQSARGNGDFLSEKITIASASFSCQLSGTV